MFLNKKRRNIVLASVLAISCLIMMATIDSQKWKIERSLNGHPSLSGFQLPSPRTHLLQNSCKYPIILPLEPSFKKHVKSLKEHTCETNNTMEVTRDLDGNFFINKPSTLSSLHCRVRLLDGALRPLAHSPNVNGKFLTPNNRWFWVNYDNFVITCVGEEGTKEYTVYQRQFMGIKDESVSGVVVKGQRSIPSPSAYNLNTLSISMLTFDSTSRTQFLRHMPLTKKIMEEMGFITLNAYNKVGDNSNVNLLPILAHPLKETADIPLFLNGDINLAKILPYDAKIDPDTIKFLWKEMEAQGCETMFNDDIMHPSRGILHYPDKYFRRGFSKTPTNHYYRPYYTHLYKAMDNQNHICWDNRSLTEEFADSWYRYTKMTRNKCAFSFNFLTSLTHDDPNNIQLMDSYLAAKLRDFHESETLQNTVLIIMGDHGQRIHNSQSSFVGRIEERSPLMSVYLPKGFRIQHPEAVQNFVDNSNRFTSNYDVHETLLDLIEREIGTIRAEARGSSLFLPIPAERSCVDNNNVDLFCLCMQDAKRVLNGFFSVNVNEKKTKQSILNYLEPFDGCIDRKSLNCQSMTPLTINKKAQLGQRNNNDWDQVKKKPAKFKVHFIEAICTLRTKSQKLLNTVWRIQHDPNSNSYDITIPPMIEWESTKLNNTNTLTTLKKVCHL